MWSIKIPCLATPEHENRNSKVGVTFEKLLMWLYNHLVLAWLRRPVFRTSLYKNLHSEKEDFIGLETAIVNVIFGKSRKF